MSAPAVVADGWFATNGWQLRVRTRLPEAWTLVDVAKIAAPNQVKVVYLLDDVGALPAPWLDGPAADGWNIMLTGGGGDHGQPWRWRLHYTPAALADAHVDIVFLPGDESATSGPWQGLGPAELLNAFSAFHRLTGSHWSNSVGRSAEQLILLTHPKAKGGTLLDRAPRTPEPALEGALETAFVSWRRELTEDEAAMPHVHAFDANAQYLAAWGVVELGHGEPVLTPAPRFDRSRFALWRYPDMDQVANLRPLLPAAWLPGREWFTTPTIARMLEVCDGLSVPEPVEAWIWPNRSRFLRPAAERLRDARAEALAELRACRGRVAAAGEAELPELLVREVTAGAVLDAVKALYRVQTGRFNMARAGAWARPEWGHAIRAQARANLHRRLDRLTVAPFAIATDGLLFASDEPDGREFAARIGLPIGTGLGQYTHDATAPLAVVAGAKTAGRAFAAIRDHLAAVRA